MKWRSKLNGTCHGSLLDTYCRQVKICSEIAMKCVEWKTNRRPTIVEIIEKLNAMEHELGMFENNQGRHIERVCIRSKFNGMHTCIHLCGNIL
jgi:hypothetical protein